MGPYHKYALLLGVSEKCYKVQVTKGFNIFISINDHLPGVNFSGYDEDSEVWHLTSSDGLVNGTSPGPINSMGTGLQTWQFDR